MPGAGGRSPGCALPPVSPFPCVRVGGRGVGGGCLSASILPAKQQWRVLSRLGSGACLPPSPRAPSLAALSARGDAQRLRFLLAAHEGGGDGQ